MQASLLKKSFVALSVVAVTAVVGVASSQAMSGAPKSSDSYSKDQCKDGGWKNFKNPDGSMMFKNQGQCVSFFVHQGINSNVDKGNGKNGDNSVTVNNDVSVDAKTGDVNDHQSSGSATLTTGDSAPSVTITNNVNANP